MGEQHDVGTREQVLDLIVEKGPVTASAIARQLGLTTAAVRRHITVLEDSGDIAPMSPVSLADVGADVRPGTTSRPNTPTSACRRGTPTSR